jgi:hypothetical protein
MKASISVVRLLDRLARAVWVIAINEFLTNSAFAPDDIKVLVTAFEGALRHLRLVNRKSHLRSKASVIPVGCVMLVVLRTLRGIDHVL